MTAITRTATALTLIITTFTAAASWDEVKEAANGDYYTAVDSSNVEANELAVYFSAERQCSPHIILFDYQSLEAEDVSDWDQVTGEQFDSTIDLNVASVAHRSNNRPAFLVFDYYRLDSGAYFGIVKIEISPDEGAINAARHDDLRVAIEFCKPLQCRAAKLVVGPGRAVGLAAILENALPKEHQRVGIVLSGGNVDPTIFAEILYSA